MSILYDDLETFGKVRRPFARVRTPVPLSTLPKRTVDSHAASCEINNIVERFTRTGQLPPSRGQPTYADVSELQKSYGELHAQLVDTYSTVGTFFSQWVKKKHAEVAEAEAKKAKPSATDVKE